MSGSLASTNCCFCVGGICHKFKVPPDEKMMTFALALVATRTLVENLHGCVKDELVSHNMYEVEEDYN